MTAGVWSAMSVGIQTFLHFSTPPIFQFFPFLETQRKLYKPTDIADRVSDVSGFFIAPLSKNH
jgi:hypothetical protein